MKREPRHCQRPRPFLLVMLLALIVGLAACEGTTSLPRPVAKDSGAPPPSYYDSGGSPTQTDGGTWPATDSGTWPTADSSLPTGSLTCSQIGACYNNCSDDACCDACYYQGSADGQAKMDALEQCWSQAETTTCKTQCAAAPDSQACWDCEDQACAAELQACGL